MPSAVQRPLKHVGGLSGVDGRGGSRRNAFGRSEAIETRPPPAGFQAPRPRGGAMPSAVQRPLKQLVSRRLVAVYPTAGAMPSAVQRPLKHARLLAKSGYTSYGRNAFGRSEAIETYLLYSVNFHHWIVGAMPSAVQRPLKLAKGLDQSPSLVKAGAMPSAVQRPLKQCLDRGHNGV